VLLNVESWYARIGKTATVATALLTDVEGNVLIVEPTYKLEWVLPGGCADADEPPHRTAERELLEETGLDRRAGQLLVIDHDFAFGHGGKPLIVFVFDFGEVDSSTAIVLPPRELRAHDFVPAGRAGELMAPYDRRRLAPALAARETGRTAYLPLAG